MENNINITLCCCKLNFKGFSLHFLEHCFGDPLIRRGVCMLNLKAHTFPYWFLRRLTPQYFVLLVPISKMLCYTVKIKAQAQMVAYVKLAIVPTTELSKM